MSNEKGVSPLYKLRQFFLMLVSHLPGKKWHRVAKMTLVDPCNPEKKMTIYTRVMVRDKPSPYYAGHKQRLEHHGRRGT